MSRLDTAGVLRKGADPRTALEKQVSKTLLLPACALVAPGFLSVSCFLSFLRGRVFLLCRGCAFFSWLLSVGADPKTEHFRRQPPSSYSVSEYVATDIGGNAGMPIVFLTFVHSPRIGLSTGLLENGNDTAACGHSVFPVPSARRVNTSYSRLSPNARRHNSSRQPHHIVSRHGCCGNST